MNKLKMASELLFSSISDLRGTLSDKAIEDAYSYVNVGEQGLGLEIIVDNIYEEEVRISSSTYEKLVQAAALMDIELRAIGLIKELVD